MTRLGHWQRPVSYAAVGATQAKDLLRYPPTGYRPLERRARIGHGDARFEYAWMAALSWGVQRNSGFRVDVLDAPPEVTNHTYIPVSFDTAGMPIVPSASGDDVVFGPDGRPFVAPGHTALLIIPFGPFGIPAPVRVVYIIDEPKRKGFAYGTLPGHPENGEEAFIVDQKPDGSVWITIRAFSRPATWYWWALYPFLRAVQEHYTKRYLRALAGPIA